MHDLRFSVVKIYYLAVEEVPLILAALVLFVTLEIKFDNSCISFTNSFNWPQIDLERTLSFGGKP